MTKLWSGPIGGFLRGTVYTLLMFWVGYTYMLQQLQGARLIDSTASFAMFCVLILLVPSMILYNSRRMPTSTNPVFVVLHTITPIVWGMFSGWFWYVEIHGTAHSHYAQHYPGGTYSPAYDLFVCMLAYLGTRQLLYKYGYLRMPAWYPRRLPGDEPDN